MSVSDAEAHRIRQRRTQLAQLVLAGLGWQAIADKLGYGSPQHAMTDWKRAKDLVAVRMETTVEEARWLEVERMDRLQAAMWPLALQGDTKAARVARQIIVDRCKLLGLEPPTQIQLSARLNLESTVVAEAIIAVVDALGLEPSQRVVAFDAAQKRLELVAAQQEADEEISG